MKMRGEITVFLSLILVCILSLAMGLLESARTTGARLYLQMAADSAMSSVMSQYNQNLWDMYQLLFLEYESEAAITNSFESYFDFYLDQENFYPMRKKSAELTKLTDMGDCGAKALEQEILSYVKYRLPEIAADLAGISEEASEAEKAGDYRNLFKVCSQAGKKTRNLERKRRDVEASVRKMANLKEQMSRAAELEQEPKFLSNAKKLKREMRAFLKYTEAYDTALNDFSEYKKELLKEQDPVDAQAAGIARQEKIVYDQAEKEAEQIRLEYRMQKAEVEQSLGILEEMILLFDHHKNGGEEITEGDGERDWGMVGAYIDQMDLPQEKEEKAVNEENEAALDWLESFFTKDLLDYLVPEGTNVSNRQISLNGIPSAVLFSETADGQKTDRGLLDRILIHEYIALYFTSFIVNHGDATLPEDRALSYEQEYILCGKKTDRENLTETVEALLTIRGAMNLTYLLSAPEKREQAESLAASVSAGNLALQILVSFFILTLWALGEAVWDVRVLLAGGRVPFWKNEADWKISLEGLLAREFLTAGWGKGEENRGRDYGDYLRILFFLKEPAIRNFRMMDLIQWNVRKKQADFSIENCAFEIEIKADVTQRHLFLMRDEYTSTAAVTRSYE